MLKDIVIFWKLFCLICLKMCLWLEGRSFGFRTTELQDALGRCPATAKRGMTEGMIGLEDRLLGPFLQWIQF
jgi:hypothetical protein